MIWKQSTISGVCLDAFCIVATSSFPVPLKNINVVRRTTTTLDVLPEYQIDGDWNVYRDRQLIRALDQCQPVPPFLGIILHLLAEHVNTTSAKRKTALGRRKKAKARQCTKTERDLLDRSGRRERSWNIKWTLQWRVECERLAMSNGREEGSLAKIIKTKHKTVFA